MYAQAFIRIDGVNYRWFGWFGAQLESSEWRRQPAGTERELLVDYGVFYRVRLYSTRRYGWKIRHAWTIELRGDIDNQNAQIREFREALRNCL